MRPSTLAWLLAGLICLTVGLPHAGAQREIKQPVVGGPVGGFTLGFYGDHRETRRLDREAVIARENYCPTGGCVLRLEGVQVRPPQAKGGQTMALATTYTILTPDNLPIPVTITRQVYFRDQSLGTTKSIEYRKVNGTWTQEVDFTLPANAAPGIYTLQTKITTGFDSVSKEAQFRVE
jgi:hypothetical protein